MDIGVLDLKELLRAAESALSGERAARAIKHGGWMRPGSLQAIRSGLKKKTHVSYRRSDEFNTEIFFADDLNEKLKEAVDAASASEDAPTLRQDRRTTESRPSYLPLLDKAAASGDARLLARIEGMPINARTLLEIDDERTKILAAAAARGYEIASIDDPEFPWPEWMKLGEYRSLVAARMVAKP